MAATSTTELATPQNSNDKKRKAVSNSGNSNNTSTPPDGYICNLCKIPGHWIQQCPQKKKLNKKQKKNKNKTSNSNHVPVAGVDPSQEDIEKARELQKIPPPHCFCGIPSRLKKVKRSHVGGESSRAIGKYFFFCSRKKTEEPCRFARPVEDEIQPKKERYCSFMLKKGTCKKGDKCAFSHDIPSELLLPQNNRKKNTKKEMKSTTTTTTTAAAADDEGDESKTEAPKTVEKETTETDDKDDKDGSSSSSSDSDSDSSKDKKSKEKDSNKKGDDESSSSDSDSSDDDEDDDQVF